MDPRQPYDSPHARNSLRQDHPSQSSSGVQRSELDGSTSSPQIAAATASPIHPLIASPTSSSRAEGIDSTTHAEQRRRRGTEMESEYDDERYYGRRIGPSGSGSRGHDGRISPVMAGTDGRGLFSSASLTCFNRTYGF